VVGPGRLELPTSRLSGVCSNQLSYRPWKRFIHVAGALAWRVDTRSHHSLLSGCDVAERETKTATLRTYVVSLDEPIRREVLEVHP
jgi:hypothetical protein